MTQAVCLSLAAGLGLASLSAPIPSQAAAPAPAAQTQTVAAVSPNDAKAGGLYVKTKDGYAEAIRLGTDIQLTVTGPIVRGRITQAFRNPSKQWVEAVYAYPLANDGAVDGLKMVIGKRVIIGEIKEREEAKAAYEAAKDAGQGAALIEQMRPNLFTNHVANIGPGETVIIQIDYEQTVTSNNGVYGLRVPLVVAPRYSSPNGSSSAPALPVMAVVDPRMADPVNPVTIKVKMAPGYKPVDLQSLTHAVAISGDTVTLKAGSVPADRDFVLLWKPPASRVVPVGLFKERVAGKNYVMAVITPPKLQDRDRLPRDVVFVIDNSGSMGGESMRQAKASLQYGLTRLSPGDRFNIVRFDDTLTALFPDTVVADGTNLARAKAFVSGIEAAGGTEMIPAMERALRDTHSGDNSRVRQVVFMTDGEVSNEDGLFKAIADHRGRSKVFMVGIGSAPNTFLMSRAAEMALGSFTHVDAVSEADGTMAHLFDQLQNPAFTNLRLTLKGVKGDFTPRQLPDVYQDQPLMITGQVDGVKGSIHIDGDMGGVPVSLDEPLSQATPAQGVSKVWARRKVQDAEVRKIQDGDALITAENEILKLGLEHGLVTSRTSLVAIDHTPKRPAGYHLTRQDIPLNLPAGWDVDAWFAAGPDYDAAPKADSPKEDGVDLPQTATPAEELMIFGATLAALGLALLIWRRPRRAEAAQ
jgi:Ca-activated chloride channel family protein